MANVDVENIYQLVKKLPASDRLRLAEYIVRELSLSAVEEVETQRFDCNRSRIFQADRQIAGKIGVARRTDEACTPCT